MICSLFGRSIELIVSHVWVARSLNGHQTPIELDPVETAIWLEASWFRRHRRAALVIEKRARFFAEAGGQRRTFADIRDAKDWCEGIVLGHQPRAYR
jgi:hypothetical protein